MKNLWTLRNGQHVRDWDHPKLLSIQEPNGPTTRIMSAMLNRLEAGPSMPTQEELTEMARLASINHGYVKKG